MKLEKEDVIQIIESERDVEFPHCFIVLDADDFNRNNKLFFTCLDIRDGGSCKVWFDSRRLGSATYFDKWISTIGPGIRIMGYITSIDDSQLFGRRMTISGIDMDWLRKSGSND